MVEDLGGWTIATFVDLLLRALALSLVRTDSPRGPVRFHFAVFEGTFVTRAGRKQVDDCRENRPFRSGIGRLRSKDSACRTWALAFIISALWQKL